MTGGAPRRRASPTRVERQAQRWINRMNDDPERYEARLDRWIRASDERREAYNRLATAMRWQTWSAGHRYATRERPAGTSRLGAPPKPIWAVAAITVALGAAAIGVVHFVGRVSQRSAPTVFASELDAPAGAVRTVSLSDGSVVLLQSGSRIDVRLTKEARRLVLRKGSAEFRVAHAPAWPFIVDAGGGSVTARGTVFQVSLADEVRVSLLQGIVDVAEPVRSTRTLPAVHHLVAGQSVHFVATGHMPRLASTPASYPTREGPKMKEYDDVMVQDVIAETNQASSTQIVLADASLGSRRVVVQLHVGDAEDVAEGLADLLGLTVDRSRPGVLILGAQE
jgi:transmembrane sensor